MGKEKGEAGELSGKFSLGAQSGLLFLCEIPLGLSLGDSKTKQLDFAASPRAFWHPGGPPTELVVGLEKCQFRLHRERKAL